jgi:hypothetical protein
MHHFDAEAGPPLFQKKYSAHETPRLHQQVLCRSTFLYSSLASRATLLGKQLYIAVLPVAHLKTVRCGYIPVAHQAPCAANI